ncbi:membrane protein [Spinactinospora alkalitolerans]|uniref:Membrane protein n=1 Tax=Spinactinospora alkalitolerans TaxID=687207 RepID=A0A852U6N8_9ACTN|nr:YihY/virulence factor BrkB family protein [Spinactinospora alkalitolerans]NYE49744.1 membrane protein [Spinactinospora alkalitolerans]
MAPLAGRTKDRLRHYGNVAMETYWALRRRRPGFDHLVRAYERYADRRGDQLAASVTYFAFLSFFPLLALAFSALGYVAAFNLEARGHLEQAINETLPGFAAQLPLDEIARARTGAGVIGLLGLLYTGLGSIAALREALHVMWLKNTADGPNFVVAKLLDTVVVIVLGLALLGSVALTGVAQTATGWLLSWVGLDGSVAAALATRLLGLVIAVGVDVAVFTVLFGRLSGTERPWRLLWRGALLAAVGFEVLKAAGALLIGSTLSNPVYASFAVLVGLLVWINIVLRFVLFAAAWTATWLSVPPPYHGTVPMSVPVATASAEPVRPAGRPVWRPRSGARLDRLRAAARRTALPLTLGLGAAALAVWVRRHRAHTLSGIGGAERERAPWRGRRGGAEWPATTRDITY